MRTVSLPAGRQGAPRAPKRLLGRRGDQHLVEQIRRGDEAAFEVAFERYGAHLLSFCRHMLGSLEEAEDAVQHTFAAAYRDLLRGDRDINLKPWLYAIARNRCLSVLRARRETSDEDLGLATAGLDEQVQRRAELRELVRDLQDLPDDQRTALLLAEIEDLSHPEVAQVLGCEVHKVKALVFRARSGLMERRRAREMSCVDIQEQLANLRGGALRRSELRHHLRMCEDCRAFREQVKGQRQLMAAVLPITPTLGFKSSVLAAMGLAGGSAGGGAAGVGLSAAGLSSATVAKIAAVAVVAGGGIAGSEAVIDGPQSKTGEASKSTQSRSSGATRSGEQNLLRRAATRRDAADRARRGAALKRARRRARRRAKVAPLAIPPENALPVGAPKRPGRGRAEAKPKKLKKQKAGKPPNPSGKAKGRGLPESAPPTAPHSEDVQQAPPPGQLKGKDTGDGSERPGAG